MFNWQAGLIIFFITWYLLVTIQSIYVHRVIAHNYFAISKSLEHFFVFCLWFALGFGQHPLWRQYYAVMHRRHHLYSDTEKDPHSPYYFTFEQLCNEQLVMQSHSDPTNPGFIPPAELAELAHRNSSSWIESNLYWKYPKLGQLMFWSMSTLIAGIPGFIVGAIYYYGSSMLVTFVGKWAMHKIGFVEANPHTSDRSQNSFLIALICGFGGEEYHRYHHDDTSKPYFHRRWYQLDLGWVCCKIFIALGLMKLTNSTLP
jgi:stearoyl-CoA desaturase (delta-9 desaturase)